MNYIDKLNYIFENINKCHICNQELSYEYEVESNSILQKRCIYPCIGNSFSFYIFKEIESNLFKAFKVFSPKNKKYITFYFDEGIMDMGGALLNEKSNAIIELNINNLDNIIQIEPPFIDEEKIKGYLLFM